MQVVTDGLPVIVENIQKRSFLKDRDAYQTTFTHERRGGMILGYTRVSKGEQQNAVPQRNALKRAKVERIFDEKASGARWDRPNQCSTLPYFCEIKSVPFFIQITSPLAVAAG